ncbi:MAG: hypothetical protein IIA03_15730 [Proteobacteria bacterium]|jgi:hypothetical protein|nr:hypothetical protein [Methylibium sp.]MBY0366878.1 hypothetical protein [Burkholderiaceae bacterium]MCH8857636.1 hypothetical protein [Pseudomonadota bacterium]|mmetsp:Transcript_663/g.1459  ORF Transcript_663/g.1459 Transcript_663/m.1459 type:complete len:136 (-) Transcript_663:684-1091(-)
MKTLFKILFIGTALMVLAAMFGGFALLQHHSPDMHIVVNDEEIFLGSSGFGDWLGASIGLFVGGAVCLVVLPLVLLLGVALPLLIVGGLLALVVFGLLGVGAVLGSPLILLALLLFVVLRNRRPALAPTPKTDPV